MRSMAVRRSVTDFQNRDFLHFFNHLPLQTPRRPHHRFVYWGEEPWQRSHQYSKRRTLERHTPAGRTTPGRHPHAAPPAKANPEGVIQITALGASPGTPIPTTSFLSPARAPQPTCSPGRSAAQPPDGPTIKLGHPVIKDTHNPPQKRAISCQILPDPDGQGTEGTQISAGAQTNPISPGPKMNPRPPGAQTNPTPRVPTNPVPPRSTGVGLGFTAHESQRTRSPRPKRTQSPRGKDEPNTSGGPKQSQSAEAQTNPIHPGPKRTATSTNHESRITNHESRITHGC